MSKLSALELMLWGLTNMWKDGKEGSYSVRHGNTPVSEFGHPCAGENRPFNPHCRNMFEGAFNPVLFVEHVRWALQYHDLCFRKHPTFPFYACGIMLRHQALMCNFEADSQILLTITQRDIELAVLEESQCQPISNPAVFLLRKYISSTGPIVMNSDQNRLSLQTKIKSTCMYVSPPSLWVTINPTQIFTGEEIDMDAFLETAGSDQMQHAKNIAGDPYAAAKFFHFLIKVVLETLFAIDVTMYQVRSRPGIFRQVPAYIGTVESQG
ncbi:hypothetical protein K439DRAFT_1508594 [Ramaria rubella]|nr:hypothetical protein K439DRAFT_1508594 [Ramaria rubella]